MALTNSQLSDLKELVATDSWKIYLEWIEQRMEATFQEMLRFETDREQFIRLQARLRTLMDVTYFFEKELLQDEPEILPVVDKGYSERFLGILRHLLGR